MEASRPARRLAIAALALWAWSPAGAYDFSSPRERQSVLASDLGHRAMVRTLRPAYRVVEGLSDGLYQVMRLSLMRPVLRGVTADELKARLTDSFALFESEFRVQEARYLRRLTEVYPHRTGLAGFEGHVDHTWSWAADEQVSVVLDALRDTLVRRYRLEDLADRKAWWRPDGIAAAGLVGGAFLYLRGGYMEGRLGRTTVGVDLEPGQKLQRALRGGGALARAVGLELGRSGAPVRLDLAWGMTGGGLAQGRYGLKYRLQF